MLGILTLFAIVVICIGIDNGDFLRQVSVLKKEITKVQTSSLNDTTATNVQLARYYLQIAMLYQQQDLALHTGGDLQRKALKYFNLAINSSSEFSVPLTLTNGIQINPLIIMVPAYYQRGMLLKMMGDGQGALESYLHVLNLFAQHPTLHAPYEKSLVYSSMADAYLLQGDLVKTIKNYYQALSITPCKTEYWYGLVNTIKEYLYTYKQPAHTHTYNSNADTRTQIQTQISAEQIQQQVHSVYMRLAQYMLLAAKLCHKQYVLVDNDSVQVVREAGDASSYRNMTISPYLALAHESFMYYYYLVYGPSHTHTSLMDLDSHINIYTEEEVMSFAYTTDIQEYAVHTSLPAMTYVYDDINQYRYATKESDMYYALSYVYDAMRMHTQAYTYIQYANRVEEELRRSRYGVQYDPTDQELSYNNSASIFTEQFYVGVQVDPQSSDGISSIQVDISNDITVSGKVKVTIEPIFIVGMMR
ncbi:hypothetical protein EON65_02570 [archaeon]|nr:MAG: hypothetical protein EON65_02570 [archaeon]